MLPAADKVSATERAPAFAATTTRGIDTRGRTLRSHAARGVMVNAAFDVGLSTLGLVQALVVAALLTRAQYGVWGILVASLGVLAQLKAIGIGDKYLQQEEPDQELAFQRAFTLELLSSGAAILLLGALLPLIALLYGHWSLLLPGGILLSVLIADALQSPLWIYYRRMNFARQRTLGAVQPIVAFVVTVALAAAGLGYWALVIGLMVGAWTSAAVAIASCPLALGWRFDRSSLRVYASFSGPIVIVTLSVILLANVTMVVATRHLGLAGAGAVALAVSITQLTERVDALVSGTLYPAICAIQNRLDLLRETFVKTNRVALMWAMPLGVALTLFAPDLVHYGLGERWRPAVGLLQYTGAIAAISHVAFNWDDYFRARSNTVPIAVASVVSAASTLGAGIPLLLTHGLSGLGVGLAIGATVHLMFKAWYVSRLFEGFRFLGHAVRAILPTIPAVAVLLLMRTLESGHRSLGTALAELSVYLVVIVGLTWRLEGSLVRECLAYLGGRPTAAA